MSSSKSVKKRIVVTGQGSKKASGKKNLKTSVKEETKVEMLFKKKNFYFLFAGLLLIALGMLLMAGGKMPSPEVWDESLIYSPRRIILAPIVILGGLVLVLLSIFKK